MKIVSGNSIYSQLIRMARKNPAVPTEKIETTVALPMQTHELPSNDERIADFYAKLTASQLELADMDHNDKVTKAEFMEGQERIAQKKPTACGHSFMLRTKVGSMKANCVTGWKTCSKCESEA